MRKEKDFHIFTTGKNKLTTTLTAYKYTVLTIIPHIKINIQEDSTLYRAHF